VSASRRHRTSRPIWTFVRYPPKAARQRKKRLSFDLEHGASRQNRHREERKG
jgi:hypothetical protein